MTYWKLIDPTDRTTVAGGFSSPSAAAAFANKQGLTGIIVREF